MTLPIRHLWFTAFNHDSVLQLTGDSPSIPVREEFMHLPVLTGELGLPPCHTPRYETMRRSGYVSSTTETISDQRQFHIEKPAILRGCCVQGLWPPWQSFLLPWVRQWNGKLIIRLVKGFQKNQDKRWLGPSLQISQNSTSHLGSRKHTLRHIYLCFFVWV